MIRRISILAACAAGLMSAAGVAQADHPHDGGGPCAGLPNAAQLRQLLANAAGANGVNRYGKVGGLFEGTRMWGALVNRDGALCAFTTSTPNPYNVWPGSQAIAKAKAYTANAFSLDDFALSTARLYTLTQPGHSLWSLGQSNLFNSDFLAPPTGEDGGRRQILGGLIFFGGGVPIYRGGRIIGGLGVSGDTSCADHEIAKRVRDLAGLNPPGGAFVDDITYSSKDGASPFTHPLCPNTYRNNEFIGTERPAAGY